MAKHMMERIAAMLEDRGDVWIDHQDPDGVSGCQLRRLWHKRTMNPDGFNPVEREHWEYYGQCFVVRERRLTKEKEPRLIKALAALCEQAGTRGGWVILADADDPLAAVIERLGPVPEDLKGYLARALK